MMNRSKTLVAMVAIALSLFLSAAPSLAEPSSFANTNRAEAVGGVGTIVDVLVVRPVTFAAGLVATALWIPEAAFLAATGNGDKAGEAFKAGPGDAFKATFTDPVGSRF